MSNEVIDICRKAHLASFKLAGLKTSEKNRLLNLLANNIFKAKEEIIKANEVDLETAKISGLSSVMLDRLKLDDKRIDLMVDGVKAVLELVDPVGEITEDKVMENGLRVRKMRAPLGTIGVIYEARPNVTIDVAILCFKSGNAVVLRGGKEAINTNRVLYNIIVKSFGEYADCVGFIDDVTRESTSILLNQSDYIDIIIPRGGEGLKKYIIQNAKMPVIASAGGNCHLYMEKTGDIDMGVEITFNAKMSRPSVCNSLEQLLVDKEIASTFLPKMSKRLSIAGCRFTADNEAIKYLDNAILSTTEDAKKEHLDYILNVQIVSGIEEAIDIINKNSTKHSDAIVSKDNKKIEMFERFIDSACVYANASTRYSDGFELGLGAEIAISTQKLHARGPLGLRELTCEKFIIDGNGQVRN